MGRWVWLGGCGEVGEEVGVGVGRKVWVGGGGCREVGVSVGVRVWEVGAGRWVWVTGVGMENPILYMYKNLHT